MRTAVKLTHLLFCLLIGFIIGAIITKETTLLIWSIVMLALDIIVGNVLQYLINKSHANQVWSRISYEDKVALFNIFFRQDEQDERNSEIDIDDNQIFSHKFNRENRSDECSSNKQNHSNDIFKHIFQYDELSKKFQDIYLRLKSNGGARFVDNLKRDEAGLFLLDVCKQMPHAPSSFSFAKMRSVSVKNLNDCPTIIYSFAYNPNSICQNAFIYLVRTKTGKIRFFTLETHYMSFYLCEYSGSRHLNYDKVEIDGVLRKINEILNTQ